MNDDSHFTNLNLLDCPSKTGMDSLKLTTNTSTLRVAKLDRRTSTVKFTVDEIKSFLLNNGTVTLGVYVTSN